MTDADGGDADSPAARMARIRATAVRLDSSPALLTAARRLRRRLPGDERFGDPLSLSGDGAAQVVARGASTLRADRPSVSHELGLSALQLWQSLSEATGRGRGDEPLAILFTDLVGFSSWALEAGDEPAVRLLRQVGAVVESAITDHGGRVVKRLGDGVMAVFTDPQGAVGAALAALDELDGIEVDGHRPSMRVGIHHGRPRRLGGDYLGVDVNIGARVGAAASGGQVLVTEAACERLDRGTFALGRSKRLKAPGAPKELRVRAVSRPAA